MIPLEFRNNQLISITIRALDLDYDKYSLMLVTEEGSTYISNETKKTIVI